MSRPRTSPADSDALERRLASLTPPPSVSDLEDRLHAIPTASPALAREAQGRGNLAPRWRPFTLAAAMVVLLIAAIVATLPARRQIAFADVERAMQGIRTASWASTFVQYDQNGHPVMEDIHRIWVRLDPPARMDQSDISSIQVRGSRGSRAEALSTPRGIIYHSDDRDPYELWPYRFGDLRAEILGQLTFSARVNTGGVSYKVTPWTSRRVTFGGRSLLLFRRGFISLDRRPGVHGRVFAIGAAWVDPRTYRLVRTEMRQNSADTGHPDIVQTTEQYRYNGDIPAAAFEMTPPPGKAIEIQDGRSDRTWGGLPRDVRVQVQRALAESQAAYLAGDIARFTAVWDFDYYPTFPEAAKKYPGDTYRRRWQAAVEQQKPWGARRIGRILPPFALLPPRYVYTRARAADPFPPPVPTDILRVQVTEEVRSLRDGKVTRRPAVYELRRENGTWKVIGQFPSASLAPSPPGRGLGVGRLGKTRPNGVG